MKVYLRHIPVWPRPENKALEKACRYLVNATGDCPYRHDKDFMNCKENCRRSYEQMVMCWMKYFENWR